MLGKSLFYGREHCAWVLLSLAWWYYFQGSVGSNASNLGDVICHAGCETGDVTDTGSYKRIGRRCPLFPTCRVFFQGWKNTAYCVRFWEVWRFQFIDSSFRIYKYINLFKCDTSRFHSKTFKIHNTSKCQKTLPKFVRKNVRKCHETIKYNSQWWWWWWWWWWCPSALRNACHNKVYDMQTCSSFLVLGTRGVAVCWGTALQAWRSWFRFLVVLLNFLLT